MNYNLNLLCVLFNIKKEEIEYDWMGFKITEENYVSAHHMDDICFGGEDSLDNLAILSCLSHRYLHEQIQKDDIDIYNRINNELKKMNKRRKYPTMEEIQTIRDILIEYETKYNKQLKKRIKFTTFNEKKVIGALGNNIELTPSIYREILEMGIDPEKKHKKIVNQKKKVKGSYTS